MPHFVLNIRPNANIRSLFRKICFAALTVECQAFFKCFVDHTYTGLVTYSLARLLHFIALVGFHYNFCQPLSSTLLTLHITTFYLNKRLAQTFSRTHHSFPSTIPSELSLSFPNTILVELPQNFFYQMCCNRPDCMD